MVVRSTARLLLVSLVAALLIAGPVMGPGTGASAAPASSRVLPLDRWQHLPQSAEAGTARAFSADDEAEGWQITEPLDAGDAVMVGIEAPSDTAVSLLLRTQVDGTWSHWTPLDFPGPDEGPDPGSLEAEEARNVTDPVWIGHVDQLQVRAEGAAADLRLHVVEIEGSLDYDPAAPGRGAANAATSGPDILGRSAWDPNNQCPPRRAASVASSARFTVVHHTASTNNYTMAEAAGQVLATCLYHRNSNGWADVGYNFLVDRYGRIYEGRAGGIDRAVIGAHAANYNTGSVGVTVLGCFDSGACHSSLGSTAMPTAAVAAVDRLTAWKFAVHGIGSHDRISYTDGTGRTVTLDTIVGHRDIGSTSCPGNQFVPFVNGSNPMKDRVAPLAAQYRAPWEQAVAGRHARSGRQDLTAFDPGTGKHQVARSTGSQLVSETWATWSTRTGWTTHLTGDFTGNGLEDRASFHSVTGNWIVNRSTGSSFSHGVWQQFRTTTDWNTHVVGDFTGNGKDDIASFHGITGNWVVSASDGSRFVNRRWAQFGTKAGWQAHLVGDFTGDGIDDVVNYHPTTGNWMLLRSTGSAFVIERWGNFQTTTGWTHLVGDFNGDGRSDVASWHELSRNWVVGRSTGTSFVHTLWGQAPTRNGWTHHLVGDVTGDRRADIVSFNANSGALWVERSTGSSFVGGRWAVLPDPGLWRNQVALDANGDGLIDVASYRPRDNTWWVSRSTGSSFTTDRWR